MKTWLRDNAQYIANVFLFFLFLDIAIHQIVMKVIPLNTPFHAWYWESVGSYFNMISAWFAGSNALSSGAADPSMLWYDIYSNSRWLAIADWTKMTLVDWAFAAQTLLMIALVLLRRKHVAVDKSVWPQCVAVFAFCSGVLFLGEETAPSGMILMVSIVVVLLANLLAIVSLLHLGRSFGILIALRKIKTGGVYSLVRHPMYGSDILLRVGYVISHLNLYTMILFLLSTGAYVYRALLEERFLAQQPAYRRYEQQVPYRFIPGVW